MKEKIKINYAGEEVEASPIEINQASENWNQYLLDDGTVIKMKLVATNVLKVENKFDSENNPLYLVKSTNVVNVSSPPGIKKKA